MSKEGTEIVEKVKNRKIEKEKSFLYVRGGDTYYHPYRECGNADINKSRKIGFESKKATVKEKEERKL